MPQIMKDLGIDGMSPKDRVAFALEIWDSLGDDRPRGLLSPQEKAELMRRDAELDARPEIALTWEQIRASIDRRS